MAKITIKKKEPQPKPPKAQSNLPVSKTFIGICIFLGFSSIMIIFVINVGNRRLGINTDSYSIESKVDSYIAEISEVMEDNLGDAYKIEETGDMISVSFWQFDLYDTAEMAREGDELSEYLWNELKIQSKQLAKRLRESMDRYGIRDRRISLNVLNEADKEEIILQYVDGKLEYDFVKDGKREG